MLFFFLNDTATTEIYTLSLHDALPISDVAPQLLAQLHVDARGRLVEDDEPWAVHERAREQQAPAHSARQLRRPHVGLRADRKSTRLNSSHANISYAVFCLKKKTKKVPS